MLKVPSLSMHKSRFGVQRVDCLECDIATGCRSYNEPEGVKVAGTGIYTVKTQAFTIVCDDSNVPRGRGGWKYRAGSSALKSSYERSVCGLVLKGCREISIQARSCGY